MDFKSIVVYLLSQLFFLYSHLFKNNKQTPILLIKPLINTINEKISKNKLRLKVHINGILVISKPKLKLIKFRT